MAVDGCSMLDISEANILSYAALVTPGAGAGKPTDCGLTC